MFELDGISGIVSSFGDATVFRDNVDSLIAEASKLIIQDDELLCSLSSLPEKMKISALFQRCPKVERIAIEEKKFLSAKEKFANPQNIVDDRYELLESLLHRLPPSTEMDGILQENFDDNSLFIGEPSVRDKSRFLLEKSLFTGMETLGLDPKETDAQDFCSIFAWNLEEAVNEKYHNSLVSMTNEYRDKIRILRFNLQDPKNPMLCAQVLAGNLSIKELISASTEALASNELKLMRRQVVEEPIKSVVLSADSTKQKPPPEGISFELAAKIRIDKSTTVRSQSPVIASAVKSEAGPSQDYGEVVPSTTSLLSPSLEQYLNKLPASLSSPAAVSKETGQISSFLCLYTS